MKKFFTRVAVLTVLATGVAYGEGQAQSNVASKCERYGEIKRNNNPSYQHINCLLTNAALESNIPPEVVKAIATQESGWKQFNDEGEPIISTDGGIGLMQITNQPKFDQERLKNDVVYNIEAGIAILNEKYSLSTLPKINGADRESIENWYFPVMAYNGIKPVNSPLVQNTGAINANAYQEKVFNIIEKNSYLSSRQLASFPFNTSDFKYDSTDSKNIEFVKKEYSITGSMNESVYHLKLGDKVNVTGKVVNLRSQPGTQLGTSSVISELAENTSLIITGDFTFDLNENSQNHFVWYPVKTSDGKTTGYISSAYLAKTAYLNWEEKTNVDSNHDWTIAVNQALDAASISNQNVYVMHNNNVVAGTKASLNDDQKSIKLEAPEKGYIAGEIYTLYVEQTVKSKSGKALKQPIKMKFTIKK